MDDRAFIRGLEGFHDRRFLAFTVLGVLVFAVVMTVVFAGFRKNHVYRSADAVTLVQPSPPQVAAAQPAGAAR
jgi:uncharacterized membrane protein